MSAIHIPSDDLKGRIIGREGRNIRSFEQLTGTNLIIDDTPECVTISCFDPVRREIGRVTMENLVADGRIHPARIEEMFGKAEAFVNQRVQEAGEQAAFDTGIHDLHPELVRTLGRLRYRTSYGQNVLNHSLEVAYLSGVMAAELGLDPIPAKRAGLLHDLGKAVDHEVEGSHAVIGADLARRFGEKPDIVHAIEAHHNDVEPSSVLAVLVQAADAVSGRPPRRPQGDARRLHQAPREARGDRQLVQGRGAHVRHPGRPRGARDGGARGGGRGRHDRARPRHRAPHRERDAVPRPGEGRGHPREPRGRRREVGRRRHGRRLAGSLHRERHAATAISRVEADLGDGFVRLRSAEAERRQAAHDIRSTEDIVIEMLRNARDAHAKSVFTAVSREGGRRRIVMVDDGDGVPPALHERVFEPRVTSKLDTMHMDKWGVHGRGMALYSIARERRDGARRRLGCGHRAPRSSWRRTSTRVGEKADQSSFPVFERTDVGHRRRARPKNILRTVCEFALECRRDCTVYLGSVTDVVATLYAFGLSSLTAAVARVRRDADELPVCKRLALAADPAELAGLAGSLGLALSERSARRVLDGEIAPLSPAARPRAHRQTTHPSAAAPRTRRPVRLRGRTGSQAGPRGSGRLRWPGGRCLPRRRATLLPGARRAARGARGQGRHPHPYPREQAPLSSA